MHAETKISVIKSFAAEIVTEEELKAVFGPSGIAGIHFKLYLADYFAYIKNKLTVTLLKSFLHPEGP